MEENVYNSLEELKCIYTDASEWLKFLEAKHAGLFAVWTALLIAVFSIDQFYNLQVWEQIVLIILICLGIMINAVALTPFLNQQTGLKKYIQKKAYNKYKNCSENAVFYVAIFVSTYNKESDYLMEALSKYKDILKTRKLDKLDELLCKDYINQIVNVSIVGSIKAYLFDLATEYIIIVMVIGFIIVMAA